MTIPQALNLEFVDFPRKIRDIKVSESALPDGGGYLNLSIPENCMLDREK
jgi:hypothetical protein